MPRAILAPMWCTPDKLPTALPWIGFLTCQTFGASLVLLRACFSRKPPWFRVLLGPVPCMLCLLRLLVSDTLKACVRLSCSHLEASGANPDFWPSGLCSCGNNSRCPQSWLPCPNPHRPCTWTFELRRTAVQFPV